jgi:IclR family acetate operon transcriptional repressor
VQDGSDMAEPTQAVEGSAAAGTDRGSSGSGAGGTVQSIERAFEILELMSAEREDMAISEFCEKAKLPLPTVHRILRTLLVNGYVFQTPRRRYALGARLVPLSRNAGGSLGKILTPSLRSIVKDVHESVSAATIDRDHARYIAHAPSEQSMRMFTQVGKEVFLHATGVGKAIMSMMPDEEIREILGRTGLPAITPMTITDIDVMMEEIAAVRRRGYALDEEEQELGVHCVAVPVRGPVQLAISVSGPQPRMTGRAVARIVTTLTAAAEDVSRELRRGES